MLNSIFFTTELRISNRYGNFWYYASIAPYLTQFFNIKTQNYKVVLAATKSAYDKTLWEVSSF